MEKTCGESSCPLWKKYKKNCPNYIESWWKAPDKEPLLVADCAPRRTFLMIQELSNRLTGVEKSQEGMRNESHKMQETAHRIGSKFMGELQQVATKAIERKEL